MITNSTTYRYTPPVPASSVQTVAGNYPSGFAVLGGYEAIGFRPPLKGEKFIAADSLKRKPGAQKPNSRVATAKENNSPTSSARIILRVVR